MYQHHLRSFVGCLTALWFTSAAVVRAEEPLRLAERFDPAEASRVEVKVTVSGRLTLPTEKGQPAKVVSVNGSSTVVYDERPLPPDEPGADRVMRIYREADFRRTLGDQSQSADIRPTVRRMVVLRSERGKKAPFSPDGPLTWGEIDLVRTDLFSPVLVPSLLPPRPVKPNDEWPAAPAAVAELTDLDPVTEGGLTIKFVSVVPIDDRRYARLSVAGNVRGMSEDGPVRQRLEGTAYFDLDASRLHHLNLTGVKELLGPDGNAVGRIEGKFVLSRKSANRVPELFDGAPRDADLKPTAESTQILYDNPDLGVRFLYPRRWRVGGVQGRQLTLEEPKGGGILMTIEPPNRVPTAEQFLSETRDYLKQQKGTVSNVEPPRRWMNKLDRFAIDADVNKERVRLEYAVLAGPEGGVTIAARLPWAEREALAADVDRVLKSLAIVKRIGK